MTIHQVIDIVSGAMEEASTPAADARAALCFLKDKAYGESGCPDCGSSFCVQYSPGLDRYRCFSPGCQWVEDDSILSEDYEQ